MTYIHEHDEWPSFRWQDQTLAASLAHVRHRQGRLIGRMEALGFKLREEAVLHTLTEDVLKSSEIEGEQLDADQVRSSIARRLGMDIAGLVPAERNVTVAVGHGKKAAKNIDAWLRGATLDATPKHAPASFDKLNTWYYSDAPKTVRPQLDLARRTSSFDEVQGGLTEDNALFEARRCMSCGNCFECDNCYGVCPDNAVIKLGPGKRFAFNYDYCKGCGVCVAECPCGAIEMVPEQV